MSSTSMRTCGPRFVAEVLGEVQPDLYAAGRAERFRALFGTV